jgi:hypothetical protein
MYARRKRAFGCSADASTVSVSRPVLPSLPRFFCNGYPFWRVAFERFRNAYQESWPMRIPQLFRMRSPGRGRRTGLSRVALRLEGLESRHLLAAGDLVITEFMASNGATLADEDGDFSDWIEIYNRGEEAVPLDGWYLTDDADDLAKWAFPNQTLAPGNFLLVFASGKDRDVPDQPLHTNFALSAAGEYLALTRDAAIGAGELEVVVDWAPAFAAQVEDVSYGIRQNVVTRQIIEAGAQAPVYFPTDDTLGDAWKQFSFNDQGWLRQSSAMGYQSAVPGFTVLDAASSGTVSNLSQAIAVLNGAGQVSSTTAIVPWVNFYDAGGGGGMGNFGDPFPFPNDSPGDDNDFAIRATGTVLIPAAGTWTFGTNSDDGLRLRINGQTVIHDDALHGPENRFGQIQLTPGPHLIELVYFERGGGAEVELFAAQGSFSSFNPRAFRLVGDIESGGLAVQTVPGATGGALAGTYASVYRNDVSQQMRGVTSSVYVRMPWFVADPSSLESVTLRVQYDDGFVAYLNGTEVARRNAPDVLTSSSVATVDRSTQAGLAVENITLTGLDSLLEPGFNLLAIHGLNQAVDGDDFLLVPSLMQLEVVAAENGYFLTPTPGDFNTEETVAGFLLDEVRFSHEAGFYEAPIQLSLDAVTEGTTLRYTLDGTEPTATRGQQYTGPLTIDRTTTLRARAFKEGFDPSDVATATYLFLDDVIRQSPTGTPPAGFPRATNINGQELDYGMDPQIVNSATWGPLLKDALTQVPSISLVMDIDDLLGSTRGIYTHANNRGRAWERPVSVELLQPDDSEGFQIDAGLRIRGGFSRAGSNPKHAFRLFFRNQYGAGKLEFPLFGDEGTDEFDGIDLRTTQNYSWAFQGDGRNTFVRDVFSRDVQGAMGQPYTRSRFYHLYINGQYWGLFQTQERAEASFAASYFGGEPEDYDVVKSAGSVGGYANEVTDGTMDAYERLADYFYQARGLSDANMDAYWRAQGMNPDGSRNLAYERLLDVDNLIDYMIITYYTGDRDGPASRFVTGRVNNYFGIFNRENPDGFKFFEHDSEHSLGTGDSNMVRPYSSGGNDIRYFNPHWMHEQLANSNSEYRQRFADRVHEHFFDDGVLTAENAQKLIDQRAAEIDLAIIAESARWGDAKRSTPFTKTDWERALQGVRSFIARRIDTVVSQFEQEGWYRAGETPRFAVNDQPHWGGRIEANDRISLFASSQIAYEPIVPARSVWKYLANGQDLGTAWRSPTYNDNDWPSGPGPFGYGDGDEATVVPCGPNAPNCGGAKYPTTYYRHAFQVADPSEHDLLRVRIQRDDGAAVYLNGVEIARSNLPANATYDTLALEVVGGSEESEFFSFEVDPTLLRAGENVLAVEIHQQSLNSSDTSFDLTLETGVLNLAGGNIYFTLDGSDPRAIGGGIAQGAQRYAGTPLTLPGTRTVTARARIGDGWGPLARASFQIDPLASAANLRISEIHYHPYDAITSLGEADVDADEFEFIELVNIGDQPIDLDRVRFVMTQTEAGSNDGIEFHFASQIIDPGEYLVVAKNRKAFLSRYGSDIRLAQSADHPFGEGEYAGSLRNSGELLTLVDFDGKMIQQFRYDDGGAWPRRADGGGSSLEVLDVTGDLNQPWNFAASVAFGGSPGRAAEPSLPGPVINELLTHTDLPQIDAVELYNPTNQTWNLGGWYLSDSGANLLRFAIPAGTILPPGGYLVWDETQLGFGFRGQSSDDAWLIAADADGRPTRFVDHVEFAAAQNGVSYGRWPNGSGVMFPQAALSLGAANAGPRQGEIVISEVHYAPANDRSEDAFIELWNHSGSAIDLTGWRTRGTFDFDFADGTIIAPQARIVLVPFDPQSQTALAHAFRSRFASGASMTLYGPFDGSPDLESGSGVVATVKLQRPEDPLQLGLGYIPVDYVAFDRSIPWPVVSGTGNAANRVAPTAFGNLPTSWIAALPSPGTAASNERPGDFDANGNLDAADIHLLCQQIRSTELDEEFDEEFDLTNNGVIDFGDLQFLIQSLFGTAFGDANLDRVFNSSDLVQIFQQGLYENPAAGAARWESGDWNCDGAFTSTDLVLAFQEGAYVATARSGPSPAASVFAGRERQALMTRWAAATEAIDRESKQDRRGRDHASSLSQQAVDRLFERNAEAFLP